MKIKPIRSKSDYKQVMTRIDELLRKHDKINGFPREGTPDADELEVLTILADAYENEHYPIASPDPIEAIKFRMEQMGLTQADLVPLLGSRPRVSEVISRKRRLTVKMIRALHDRLRIPAEVLIQDPKDEEVRKNTTR